MFKNIIKPIILFFIRKLTRINNTQILLIIRGYSGSNGIAVLEGLKKKSSYNVICINENEQIPFFNFYRMLYSSRLIITTHGFVYKKKKRTKLLELWHGAPIKGMCLMDKELTANKKEILRKRFNQSDYIISLSPFYNTCLNATIGIDGNKYLTTGYPRNDYLFENYGKRYLTKYLDIDISEDKNIIFYVPTFRRGFNDRVEGNKRGDNIFGFKEFDNERFSVILKKLNAIIIVKMHPNEEKMNLQFNVKEVQNIFYLKGVELDKDKIDFYQLLNSANILITDYSSVYIDFLLLTRPIIFLPIDLAEYKKTRHILQEPFDYFSPGPICLNQTELENEIIHSLTKENYFLPQRIEKRNIWHFYKDNLSTDRVINLIDEILNN